MVLKTLSLQNFRNYQQAQFSFSPQKTVIVAPNGRGKSNLLEALFLLATGKNVHAEHDKQVIQFDKGFCRIIGKVTEETKETDVSEGTLEVVFADQGTGFLKKKYLINGVARRRADFAGEMTAVLFVPSHLDIVSGSPSLRRRYLDEVLEQTDIQYRRSLTAYIKALRQRNALLQQVQETGKRDARLFLYWDELLIAHGMYLTKKREELLYVINQRQKDFFSCFLEYDKSEISEQRLQQYKQAEIGAGVTLVGPHRDDFVITMPQLKESVAVRYFASRGQQRLVSLELKLAQIAYMTEKTRKNPLLLLDDIFSELDGRNIEKVLRLIGENQMIMTTTHKEFISGIGEKGLKVIELNE